MNENSNGGALEVEDGYLTVIETSFSNNVGGGVYANTAVVNIQDSTFTANVPALLGGAVFASESNVTLSGDITMTGNFAQYGGGIAAVESTVEFAGNFTVHENTAAYGGALYAQESFLYFSNYTSISNNIANYGGGAYALRSDFYFSGSNCFTGNFATIDGGGLLLVGNSVCNFLPNTTIEFISNFAGKTGGAINSNDLNPLTYCTEQSLPLQTLCFFHVPPLSQYNGHPNITLSFYNNSATDGGGDIFGGSIDNCEIPAVTTVEGFTSGEVFDLITDGNTGSLTITSVPLQIYSCENVELDCNSLPLQRAVYPGGNLQVSVVLLGQRGGIIADDVRTFLMPGSQIDFESNQRTQRTNTTCTTLDYTIRSSAVNTTQEKFLYPVQGPCPRVFINVSIQILPCPSGFELSPQQECVCDRRLNSFVETCNADNGTILRDVSDTYWIRLDNETQTLIIHPECVNDYCISRVPLSISVNNSDEQCNYNRTGVVCGGCSEGFSVVLSSSRCLQCSNNYLALLVPFAFAGITLVFLLFVLNLTVSVGSINGLIFYANILAASNIFNTRKRNILTVFIAWINLDLGIETCFYDGMDQYVYTWLQFLFPIYIWFLVGLLVLVSKYSSKIAGYLGKNPISVLATLLLLSYTKLFRNICAATSYTDVLSPSETRRVWFDDGNLVFLRGKHIPLFLFAVLLFVIFSAPYTLILLLGGWLRRSNSRFVGWVNSPRLMKPLLDAYYAPYKDGHHYWTGWLIVLRFILLLLFVVNSFGNTSFNIFIIILVSFSNLTIAWITGGLYKNWCFNVLECFFHLQLGVFATGTYYVSTIDGNQAALSYTMLSIDLVVFVGIIIFHSLWRVSDSEPWKVLGTRVSQYLNKQNGTGMEFEFPVQMPQTDTRDISIPQLREPLIEEM